MHESIQKKKKRRRRSSETKSRKISKFHGQIEESEPEKHSIVRESLRIVKSYGQSKKAFPETGLLRRKHTKKNKNKKICTELYDINMTVDLTESCFM